MSLRHSMSIKRLLSQGFSGLLTLSLTSPAFATNDLTPFYRASESHTSTYLRYTQLKTTGAVEISQLKDEIANLDQQQTDQSSVVATLKSKDESLKNRMAVIPSLITVENTSIQNAKSTINQTLRDAAKSRYYKDGTVVSKSSLSEKASVFQEKVDDLQDQIDDIQASIDEKKSESEYLTLVSEKSRLELLKDSNLRSIQIRGDENIKLREQIAAEKNSLNTWRQIQSNKRSERDRLETRDLPPLESDLRMQRDDLEDLRRRQSTLLFEKQRLESEIQLKQIELSSENENLIQAERRLQNAQGRLREAERTLDQEPQLRREKRQLIGEGQRDGGGNGRGGHGDGPRDRDRQGQKGMSIPEAQAQVAEKQKALREAQEKVAAEESVRASKQAEIDQLNEQIKESDQRVANINQQIEKTQKEIRQSENAGSEIEKLKNILDQKRAQLTEAESVLSEKQSTHDKIKVEVHDMSSQIKNLEAELTALKKRFRETSAGDEKKELRKKVENLVMQLGIDNTPPKDPRRKIVNPNGLIPQKNKLQNRLKNLRKQMEEAQNRVADVKNFIQSTESKIADLKNSKDKQQELQKTLQNLKNRLQNQTQQKDSLVAQRATLRQQRDAAGSRKEKAVAIKSQAEKQVQQAKATLNQLNRRLADIEDRLSSMDRVRKSIPRLRDAIQDGQRDVSTTGRIVRQLNEDLDVLTADAQDYQNRIDDLGDDIHSLARRVETLNAQVVDLRNQLNQVNRELAQAIDGANRSANFITSAENKVADNEDSNRQALDENRQISEDLIPLAKDIAKYESENIEPLEKGKAQVINLRDAEQNHVDAIEGWLQSWIQAEESMSNSEQIIVSLTEELANSKIDQASNEILLQEAQLKLAGIQSDLVGSEQQLSQLQLEIATIPQLLSDNETALDNIVAQLKASTGTDENTIVASEAILSSDENLSDSFGKRDWKGGIVEAHALYQSPACLAYTTVVDEQGKDIARLEVVAKMANSQKPELGFSEPTVQVVVFDPSLQFLDGEIKTNGMRQSASLTYAKTAQSSEVQAALARIGDRESIISRLRKDDSVKATLNDQAGQLVDMEFSLSGSWDTIGTAFEKCGLKFSDLPEVQ